MNLPPGFDVAAQLSQYASIALPFAVVAGLIAEVTIYITSQARMKNEE